MIVSVRPKDPTEGVGETYVACDACTKKCEGSVVRGTRGESARDQASELAKALGWEDRLTKNGGPRTRKMSWTVNVVCPDCVANNVPVDPDRYAKV